MSLTKKSAFIVANIAVLGLFFFPAMKDTAEAALWQKLVDYGYAGYSETSRNWRTYSSPESVNNSYRYLSREVGDGTRKGTATWQIEIPYSGIYRVTVSCRKTENRTPDADYYVTNSNNGLDHIVINQINPRNILVWDVLGLYSYEKGQTVLVRLDGTDDSWSDCADATLWELVETRPDPKVAPTAPPNINGARSLLLDKPKRR
ncbi:MAG: hypothetical protein OEM01_00485 [Desulfobulbaceae bacterium]|nr:hypothetical protein [Desulfobulbaceae bacterium]